MKSENLVCSLESSKKLKELGFCQDSFFYWEVYPNLPPSLLYGHRLYPTDREHFAAFTVGELGGILPKASIITTLNLDDRGHSVGVRFNEVEWYTEHDKNEAEARAKMLIYLKEKGIL